MLRLVIFVSMLNLVYGLIKIESQPAKVANGDYVKLVCDVGTMKNNVKWVYGGVTYFTCRPPFRPTDCFTNNSNHGYNFSVNSHSLIVVIPVSKKKNDGIWFCYHGKEKADFKIHNGDAPKITNFRSTPLEGENGKYTFQCKTESKVPADVVIYSHTYLGVNKLYEMNQTIFTDHDITTSVLCADYRIFCNVSNGYGRPISNYTSVTKECPAKILHNLSPNTTLTFNETDLNTHLEFIVYFEGNPIPSASFYRVTEDGCQPVVDNVILDPTNPTWVQSGYYHIIFQDLEESDAGEYVLTLKQKPRFHSTSSTILTLVYTGKAGESIQKSTSMIQTVLIPLLVLFLIIVGALWFSRIKRKPAASEDKPDKVAKDINRRYREDIRQNYVYLTDEIPLALVLPSLYGILHISDYESLRRRIRIESNRDCNQDLLQYLQQRQCWWRALREALVRVDRTDIIRQLGWDENTFDFGPRHEDIKNQERRIKHSRKLRHKNCMCIKNKINWLKDFFQQRMGNNTQNGDMLTEVLYQKIRTEEI